MTHVPGCEECGNDDGPHHYEGQNLCLDCLELLYPGGEKRAVDLTKVDPIHLTRLRNNL